MQILDCFLPHSPLVACPVVPLPGAIHRCLNTLQSLSLSNFLTVINLPATWIQQIEEREGEGGGVRGKHRNILFYFFFFSTPPNPLLCSLHTLLLIYIAHNFCSLCGARRICEAKWKPTLRLYLSFCLCVFMSVCVCGSLLRSLQDVQLTSASLPPADWLLGCPLCWFLMQSKSKAIAMFVSHSTSRYPVKLEFHVLLCRALSVGIPVHFIDVFFIYFYLII